MDGHIVFVVVCSILHLRKNTSYTWWRNFTSNTYSKTYDHCIHKAPTKIKRQWYVCVNKIAYCYKYFENVVNKETFFSTFLSLSVSFPSVYKPFDVRPFLSLYFCSTIYLFVWCLNRHLPIVVCQLVRQLNFLRSPIGVARITGHNHFKFTHTHTRTFEWCPFASKLFLGVNLKVCSLTLRDIFYVPDDYR